MRVLIAGCGYVGSALAKLLVEDGHTVTAIRRNVDALPEWVERFSADLSVRESLTSLPADFDYVFYTASASGGFEKESYQRAYVKGLENVLSVVHTQEVLPKRIFFTSSTRVYAECDGGWVDESSPVSDTHFAAQALLEGEALVHASSVPGTVVRYSGIYGPGRDRLIRQVQSGVSVSEEEARGYTNRIHRDDCTGILHFLMGRESIDSVYLGSDDAPVVRGEVYSWLAEKTNSQFVITPGDKTSKPTRPLGSKRCSNKRIQDLGYFFCYPTYREGYGSIM